MSRSVTGFNGQNLFGLRLASGRLVSGQLPPGQTFVAKLGSVYPNLTVTLSGAATGTDATNTIIAEITRKATARPPLLPYDHDNLCKLINKCHFN